MRSVCEDCLNGVNLGFIFLKTSFNGVDSKSAYNSFTSVDCRVGDIGKGSYAHNLKSTEFGSYSLDTARHIREVYILGCGIDFLKTFGCPGKVKALLELLKSRH